MRISQTLLPEFDHEMASTRRLLERLPADRADWQPHPKSMALSGLATHLANVPFWASMTVATDELDLAPPGGEPMPSPTYTGVDDLLATFDKNVADARAALAGASDACLMGPWTLKKGGHAIFTMSRVACLRSFVVNHMIHHRGQLSVYLRQLDVPLPAIYGPSADDAGGM